LAVLYLRENKGVGLTRVKDWFGEENVIAVDEFLS
jgi:DNA helicase-2/ATP-dependent DNA helicase PcrA